MAEVEFASALKEHVLSINLYYLNAFYKILVFLQFRPKNGSFLHMRQSYMCKQSEEG